MLKALSRAGARRHRPVRRRREILKAAGRPSLEVEVQTKAPGQPDAIFDRLRAGLRLDRRPGLPGLSSTFSYIAHFVEVRVEPGTRRIRVPRVVSVADCGRVMSPRTAASQVRGGVVWGIGAALREASEVDPRYGGFLNADLAEYVVPVNADIGSIEVEFIDKPDFQFNSAGVKGLGEVSMTGAAGRDRQRRLPRNRPPPARSADPSGECSLMRMGKGEECFAFPMPKSTVG